MNIEQKFLQCIERKFEHSTSMYSYKCKLGLWEVSGEDEKVVSTEAFHYFRQYFADGEYAEILGGPDVKHVFMNKFGR